MTSSAKRLLSLALALGCVASEAQLRSPGLRSADPQHGTVNVFFAQRDSLVAVTDSMLTSDQGHHEATGLKLYRLDDRTICAMAGFYSNPGPNALETLAASIPRIVQYYIDFSKEIHDPREIPFWEKAQRLQSLAEGQLTTHIRALLTANADVNYQGIFLQLTMAGYDLDGTLQVADITMRPMRTPAGVSFGPLERELGRLANPPCEFAGGFKRFPHFHETEGTNGPTIHTVGDSLFCDIAGVPDVAEELLAHPSAHPDLRGLDAYTQTRTRGTDLSLSELRSLALYLVDQTGIDERRNRMFRVGGEPQIAVLSGGRVQEAPPDLPAESGVGGGLLANNYSGAKLTCPPGRIYVADSATPLDGAKPFVTDFRPVVDVQADLTNCTQPIDGIIFHDSSFTDSIIIFSNAGPLLFGQNNVITRTSLQLGPNVDASGTDVHRLICGFAWKAVYQNGKELKVHCP